MRIDRKVATLTSMASFVFGIAGLAFSSLPAVSLTESITKTKEEVTLFQYMFGSESQSIGPTPGLIVAFAFAIAGILAALCCAFLCRMKKSKETVSFFGILDFLFFLTSGILVSVTPALAGITTGTTFTISVKLGPGIAVPAAFLLLAAVCSIPSCLAFLSKKKRK
ncbi:MAG: hypothetical protein WCR16_03695 [Bacilli bacterium]|jgi:cytochrome bd-type quinol oxidase subunit 2